MSELEQARLRLDEACRRISAILDGGDRDPTWHESQEFEEAGILLGRLLNATTPKRSR